MAVSSMTEDLIRLGLTPPKSDGVRIDVWEFVCNPAVTPELREARVQEIKDLEKKFLGKKVFRKTEIGGTQMTVVYIRPNSALYRTETEFGSAYEVYLRWGRNRGCFLPLTNIELVADER